MKAVVFDLGNVLINFDHRRAARRISSFSALAADEIYRLFFDSEITGAFEEGSIAPGDFYEHVRRVLNARLSYEQFLPIWNEIFFLTDDNLSLHKLARSLSGHYRVSVLSNINTLHLSYIRRSFPFFSQFPLVLASCELGVRKPAPSIYRQTLEKLEVSPGECFYTDDRPELISAARSMGIRAFVYRGHEQLLKDLRSSGITVPAHE